MAAACSPIDLYVTVLSGVGSAVAGEGALLEAGERALRRRLCLLGEGALLEAGERARRLSRRG